MGCHISIRRFRNIDGETKAGFWRNNYIIKWLVARSEVFTSNNITTLKLMANQCWVLELVNINIQNPV